MAILVNHPLSFATFSMAMSNYQRVKLGGGLDYCLVVNTEVIYWELRW